MNKRFISILSLSRSLPLSLSPLSSMSAIPFSLRGWRRIIGLVFIIIFNIIPGLFIMAFSGYHVGLTLGRGLFGGYMMRLAGRGIVDPVDATMSQRCFYSHRSDIYVYVVFLSCCILFPLDIYCLCLNFFC